MEPVVDVAVVGGGVVGLSIAWELLRRGESVAIIDRRNLRSTHDNDSAQPTSWTAAGILPPANFERATDPMERLRGFSHALIPVWCDQLRQRTGIDPGLIPCGGVYLAETAGEAAALTGMAQFWQDLNIDCESLSVTELLARQPELTDWASQNQWIQSHPENAAWWTPGEYQVRPPRLLSALVRACELEGATWVESCSVDQITEATGEGVSLRSNTNEICIAKRAVLCGGVSTGFIEPAYRLEQAIIPIRGQMLLLESDQTREPAILNLGNRYLIARGDGNVLVGSCEEEVGFVQETTEPVLDELRAFAGRLCPALLRAHVRDAWAGLRPMTFDGFPMLGKLPDRENVFVAAGHYRSGIHLASGTAVALVDLLQGKQSFMDLSAFSVGKQQSTETSFSPVQLDSEVA